MAAQGSVQHIRATTVRLARIEAALWRTTDPRKRARLNRAHRRWRHHRLAQVLAALRQGASETRLRAACGWGTD
jgi:hypothetical protein